MELFFQIYTVMTTIICFLAYSFWVTRGTINIIVKYTLLIVSVSGLFATAYTFGFVVQI